MGGGELKCNRSEGRVGARLLVFIHCVTYTDTDYVYHGV